MGGDVEEHVKFGDAFEGVDEEVHAFVDALGGGAAIVGEVD